MGGELSSSRGAEFLLGGDRKGLPDKSFQLARGFVWGKGGGGGELAGVKKACVTSIIALRRTKPLFEFRLKESKNCKSEIVKGGKDLGQDVLSWVPS